MKTYTLNVLAVSDECIKKKFRGTPSEQIELIHISEESIPQDAIRNARLVYYIMPDGSEKPVKVLKNVWGATGLMSIDELQPAITKCNRIDNI